MRLSRMFLPTLKESPSDAEVVSHRLMVRAGMIRKLAAGVYNLLPMGLRVVQKVEGIVREEMNRAGGCEVSMPVVQPSELWRESGRWDVYGKELLRLKDRHGREFCLGPTHEEVITDMVRNDVRSYRELPLNLYQIQTKFRDEIRPRFGLMRGREFIMKDAYSFHADEESANKEYKNMYDAYTRIFERCGLEFRAVEAETGSIGGSFSHEFMVLADTGEDAVASCTGCDYAANTERAEIRQPEPSEQGQGVGNPGPEAGASIGEIETVSTPGVTTIEEVSSFLGVEPKLMIKTLLYVTDSGDVVAALVRGDSDVNEPKLLRVINENDNNDKKADTITLADDEAVTRVTGAPVGFAGPVGLDIPIYADWGVLDVASGATGAVTGANRADTHIINVVPGRDFKATYIDLRTVKAGDPCPRCDSKFEIKRGIEVGHIFKLGTKYSEAMGATFLDENGREQLMIMGCYGIGIGRTAAAAVEQNHDDAGIVWPAPLAPFDCIIVPVNMKDEDLVKASEELYSELVKNGLEVLLDDRGERAGVKFKDADLIGVPIRVTVGSRALKQGSVEIKQRSSKDEPVLVKTEDAAEEVIRISLNPA